MELPKNRINNKKVYFWLLFTHTLLYDLARTLISINHTLTLTSYCSQYQFEVVIKKEKSLIWFVFGIWIYDQSTPPAPLGALGSEVSPVRSISGIFCHVQGP